MTDQENSLFRMFFDRDGNISYVDVWQPKYEIQALPLMPEDLMCNGVIVKKLSPEEIKKEKENAKK